MIYLVPIVYSCVLQRTEKMFQVDVGGVRLFSATSGRSNWIQCLPWCFQYWLFWLLRLILVVFGCFWLL